MYSLELIESKKLEGKQVNNFRINIQGNNGYFTEVDYTVITYNSRQRTLTVNWYNMKSTPMYVPVKVGVSIHMFSGNTYKMDIWKTPNNVSPGVVNVDKRFVVDREWTIQVEARTVKAYGNIGDYGTTYIPQTVVRNH